MKKLLAMFIISLSVIFCISGYSSADAYKAMSDEAAFQDDGYLTTSADAYKAMSGEAAFQDDGYLTTSAAGPYWFQHSFKEAADTVKL